MTKRVRKFLVPLVAAVATFLGVYFVLGISCRSLFGIRSCANSFGQEFHGGSYSPGWLPAVLAALATWLLIAVADSSRLPARARAVLPAAAFLSLGLPLLGWWWAGAGSAAWTAVVVSIAVMPFLVGAAGIPGDHAPSLTWMAAMVCTAWMGAAAVAVTRWGSTPEMRGGWDLAVWPLALAILGGSAAILFVGVGRASRRRLTERADHLDGDTEHRAVETASIPS